MAEEIWMLQTKKADFNRIAERFGIDPVTARIIRNRGIEGEEQIDRYLNGGPDQLYSPYLLKDMDRAAAILKDKLEAGERIRIVGDYDIDGVCSTYILLQAFRRLGAKVDYDIPDRVKDGYGINESIIEKAREDGVDTILTCDNGISARQQIALAKSYGMTVVVTDHHEVPTDESGELLPPADAVIDPKQKECTYPFPEICGAVVAYKLVEVLYEACGIPREEWRSLLEFAAIATVGDVMRLQDENRILVKYGLKQMAHTKNWGLRKLAEKNNLNLNQITAYHIGFVIGPCLNAGGRLQTAKLALALLLTETEEEADRLAVQLKELNDIRKDMTEQGTQEAKLLVDSYYENDSVLVVFLPECHESLAGIIAGRLREFYQKPAIVLTRGETAVKGSGRSIEGYHMFQKLCEVQDLLLKFGGHPMAAGLSLEEAKIEEFRRRLNENSGLTEEDFRAKVWIDVPMPVSYVRESLVQELRCLEPFGQGNEKPLFAEKSLRIRSARVIGRNRNVIRMTLEEENGFAMEALYFGDGDAFEEERDGRRRIDIVYYPEINEYNGNRSLQAVIRRYKFR
ncbi:MAG: single-stranded-DNA-specific exonuclease RecJ [Clostridium sp.]|nr:single-stranded-DNA-specific exonuclease RecJ [Clostridium sp.]